ncbi:hypothetical protein CPB84DRAFT_173664 [Gymnopilus junonius]|uniref:Uncharacterized protein n=1 Tax=Gymnopilus junonius TaxID=109634 RepID=A0A9P5NHP4_GYMJU|nr:hypothetical protein CPB84DRAFT_173664 [Gymnopilus junonius]
MELCPSLLSRCNVISVAVKSPGLQTSPSVLTFVSALATRGSNAIKAGLVRTLSNNNPSIWASEIITPCLATAKAVSVLHYILSGRSVLATTVWLQVLDNYGNSLDLSAGKHAMAVDTADSNNDLAWMPFKKNNYTARKLKKLIIVDELGLNPGKYNVYSTEDADGPFDDGDIVDLESYGLKKKAPITFKQKTHDDDDEDDEGSGSNSEDSESESSDSENSVSNDDGASSGVVPNSDPYRLFTKPVQCTSNADWSRYADLRAIQNTYQGEILWTDGNLLPGIPNMSSFSVVRKDPNTGAVLAYGCEYMISQ